MLIRNQMSTTKGFKVKQALQMSMLLAICIWLVYQLQQHSHDKKALEEEESSENTTGDMQISEEGPPPSGGRGKFGGYREPSRSLEKDEEESDEEVNESKAEEIEEEPEVVEDMVDEDDTEREEESEDTENDLEGQVQNEDDTWSNTQEAREEHYKGDNTFSGVKQNTHFISNRLKIGSLRRVKQARRGRDCRRD